jgi:hypothetical protein
MKYKVGDKVRIRRDLSASDDGVNRGMAQLAGTITTIKCVYNPDGVFLLDADGCEWFWTNEMLEGLANAAPSITKRINDKNNVLNGLANSDAIKPDYYQFHGYDVFDIAEHFGLSFPLGNALKYILRHKDETKRLEDLKKARQCLDRAIELMEDKDNV